MAGSLNTGPTGQVWICENDMDRKGFVLKYGKVRLFRTVSIELSVP